MRVLFALLVARGSRLRSIVTLALLMTVPMLGARVNSALAAFTPGDPPPTFSPADPRTLDSDIARGLAALRQRPGAWVWQDLLDRGRLAVASGDLDAASAAFELAVQSASHDEERVIAQYYWGTTLLALAQSMGEPARGVIDQVAGAWSGGADSNPRRTSVLQLAGAVLNEAQHSSPLSRDIAVGRVMAWSMLEDDVETIAAEHQLRVIDPAMEGTARSSLAAAARIVLAVCKVGRIVLLSIDLDGVIEPEQRLALLDLMDTGAATAEKALELTQE